MKLHNRLLALAAVLLLCSVSLATFPPLKSVYMDYTIHKLAVSKQGNEYQFADGVYLINISYDVGDKVNCYISEGNRFCGFIKREGQIPVRYIDGAKVNSGDLAGNVFKFYVPGGTPESAKVKLKFTPALGRDHLKSNFFAPTTRQNPGGGDVSMTYDTPGNPCSLQYSRAFDPVFTDVVNFRQHIPEGAEPEYFDLLVNSEFQMPRGAGGGGVGKIASDYSMNSFKVDGQSVGYSVLDHCGFPIHWTNTDGISHIVEWQERFNPGTSVNVRYDWRANRWISFYEIVYRVGYFYNRTGQNPRLLVNEQEVWTHAGEGAVEQTVDIPVDKLQQGWNELNVSIDYAGIVELSDFEVKVKDWKKTSQTEYALDSDKTNFTYSFSYDPSPAYLDGVTIRAEAISDVSYWNVSDVSAGVDKTPDTQKDGGYLKIGDFEELNREKEIAVLYQNPALSIEVNNDRDFYRRGQMLQTTPTFKVSGSQANDVVVDWTLKNPSGAEKWTEEHTGADGSTTFSYPFSTSAEFGSWSQYFWARDASGNHIGEVDATSVLSASLSDAETDAQRRGEAMMRLKGSTRPYAQKIHLLGFAEACSDVCAQVEISDGTSTEVLNIEYGKGTCNRLDEGCGGITNYHDGQEANLFTGTLTPTLNGPIKSIEVTPVADKFVLAGLTFQHGSREVKPFEDMNRAYIIAEDAGTVKINDKVFSAAYAYSNFGADYNAYDVTSEINDGIRSFSITSTEGLGRKPYLLINKELFSERETLEVPPVLSSATLRYYTLFDEASVDVKTEAPDVYDSIYLDSKGLGYDFTYGTPVDSGAREILAISRLEGDAHSSVATFTGSGQYVQKDEQKTEGTCGKRCKSDIAHLAMRFEDLDMLTSPYLDSKSVRGYAKGTRVAGGDASTASHSTTTYVGKGPLKVQGLYLPIDTTKTCVGCDCDKCDDGSNYIWGKSESTTVPDDLIKAYVVSFAGMPWSYGGNGGDSNAKGMKVTQTSKVKNTFYPAVAEIAYHTDPSHDKRYGQTAEIADITSALTPGESVGLTSELKVLHVGSTPDGYPYRYDDSADGLSVLLFVTKRPFTLQTYAGSDEIDSKEVVGTASADVLSKLTGVGAVTFSANKFDSDGFIVGKLDYTHLGVHKQAISMCDFVQGANLVIVPRKFNGEYPSNLRVYINDQEVDTSAGILSTPKTIDIREYLVPSTINTIYLKADKGGADAKVNVQC